MYHWEHGIKTDFADLTKEYNNWLLYLDNWSKSNHCYVNFTEIRHYSNMYLVMLMCDYEDNLETDT